MKVQSKRIREEKSPSETQKEVDILNKGKRETRDWASNPRGESVIDSDDNDTGEFSAKHHSREAKEIARSIERPNLITGSVYAPGYSFFIIGRNADNERIILLSITDEGEIANGTFQESGVSEPPSRNREESSVTNSGLSDHIFGILSSNGRVPINASKDGSLFTRGNNVSISEKIGKINEQIDREGILREEEYFVEKDVLRGDEFGIDHWRNAKTDRVKGGEYEGRIIMLVEGRNNDGSGDTGNIDILCTYSDDEGETWIDPFVVADNGEGSAIGAGIVTDRNGDIHVFWMENAEEDGSIEYLEFENQEECRFMHIKSSDGMNTFTEPRNLFPLFSNEIDMLAAGNARGVQARDGTLIIPCWCVCNSPGRTADSRNDPRQYRAFHSILLRKEKGKDFEISNPLPQRWSNECSVALMPAPKNRGNEIIYINSRVSTRFDYGDRDRENTYINGVASNNEGSSRSNTWRHVSRSFDVGKTIVNEGPDRYIPTPETQASVMSLTGGGEDRRRHRLIYMSPLNPQSRRNMGIMVSWDQGRTWGLVGIISESDVSTQTCALCPSDDDIIYGCYGRGNSQPGSQGTIRFVKLSLSKLAS